jgi:hypothetical protein
VIRSYLSDPFGMLCEEEFKSMQFLGNTLDVVQTVDTNNDLDTTEALLELSDTVLDALLFQVLSKDRSATSSLLLPTIQKEIPTHIDESRRLNADGERSNVRESSFEFHSVWHRREIQDSGARGKEVPGIVVGVEAYQITVENSQQDLASNGQDPDSG